jgi:flagellar biosynthesis protein FlhF
MRIKKFEAVNMREALRLVKNEMGPHAVILSTRSLKRGEGAFGLFGRPVIEVTAALDGDNVSGVKDQKAAPLASDHYFSHLSTLIDPLRNDINAIKEMMGRYSDGGFPKGSDNPFRGEIDKLKSKMDFIIKHSGMAEDFAIDEGYLIPYQQMLSRGINEEYASDIIHTMQKKGYKIQNNTLAIASAADRVMKSTKVSGPLYKKNDPQKVVAFVGPTGVGKTTSIAKLSAAETFAKNRVAIITIDTYRVAAVEQIKIYAKIIGIPVDVVLTPEELKESLRMHRDKDIIMIDTAGRSHKNDKQLHEISEFLNPSMKQRGTHENFSSHSIEIHLVISANSDEKNIGDTIDKFRGVTTINSLLFTKLDETDLFGALYNQSLRTGIPLSYFTTGQKVPEDIEAATPERVADLIFQLSKAEN